MANETIDRLLDIIGDLCFENKVMSQILGDMNLGDVGDLIANHPSAPETKESIRKGLIEVRKELLEDFDLDEVALQFARRNPQAVS